MTTFYSTLLLTGLFAVIAASARAEDSAAGPLGFKMKSINGEDVDLSQYKGKVVLMVNVASKCGLTPQYEGLESVYEKYQDKGFVVLGFPCNGFLWQEPGSDAQIAEFCSKTYQVKFPMFSKIEVNGKNASPLYQYLTALDTNPTGKGKISWNFEKFLIGRDGKVVARFSPRTEPDSKEVVAAIETELAKN
jgi:glutathione peroxidase